MAEVEEGVEKSRTVGRWNLRSGGRTPLSLNGSQRKRRSRSDSRKTATGKKKRNADVADTSRPTVDSPTSDHEIYATPPKSTLEGSPPVTVEELKQDESSEDELPDVKINFGTPVHKGLTFDQLREGKVYWMKYPRWPPWPGMIVKKVSGKYPSVKAVFFSDVNGSFVNGKLREYTLKKFKGVFFDFSEETCHLDKFKADHIVNHPMYQKQRELIEEAIQDAKQFLLRQSSDPDCNLLDAMNLFTKVIRRRDANTDSVPKPEVVVRLQEQFDQLDSVSNENEYTPFGVCDTDPEDQESEEENMDLSHAVSPPVREALIHTTPCQGLACEISEVLKYLQGQSIKEELQKIASGQLPSERHKIFFSPHHDTLKYKTHLGFLNSFQEQDREAIVKLLSELVDESKKGNDAFSTHSYVFEVLLPEAIMRIMSYFGDITMAEAHKKYEDVTL